MVVRNIRTPVAPKTAMTRIPLDAARGRITRALTPGTELNRAELSASRPLILNCETRSGWSYAAQAAKGIVICRVDENLITNEPKPGPFLSGLPRVFITAEDTELLARFMASFLTSKAGEPSSKKAVLESMRRVLLSDFVDLLQLQSNQPLYRFRSFPEYYNYAFIPRNIYMRFLVGENIPAVLRPYAKVFLGFKQGYADIGTVGVVNAIKTFRSPMHLFWTDLYRFHNGDWSRSNKYI